MGWGQTTPQVDAQLRDVLDAYDQLWHRARRFAGGLAKGLPSPHELRTGETSSDVMDALRRGEHLHELGGASS